MGPGGRSGRWSVGALPLRAELGSLAHCSVRSWNPLCSSQFSFMPGKYNPFRPDKILPPGSFVGRIPEIRTLDHCLTQTKHGNPQHFLLEGERGIGKSSLLRVQTFVAAGQIDIMDSKQRVSFVTVSLSLQEDDDYFAILRKIVEGLKREVASRERLKSLALSAWDLISRIEGAGFRLRDAKASDQGELLATVQNDIATLIENLGEDQDGVFLIIDEADRPSEAAGLGKICKLLTEELSRRNLDRLCIGLPGLLNKLRGSHESSPRLFQTLSLQPLEPRECHAVVERALAEALKKNGFATAITPDAIKYVCDLSEGYTSFPPNRSQFGLRLARGTSRMGALPPCFRMVKRP